MFVILAVVIAAAGLIAAVHGVDVGGHFTIQ
jgi:hypothetical protein